MAIMRKISNLFFYAVVIAIIIAIVFFARGYFYGMVTIHQLLAENKELKQAITNLTQEDQIGYAKIISQEEKDGKFFTTIKFVETDRNDKTKKILEKEYAIEGDIVHFDVLIVKFGDKMVMDGKEKGLYLWRRIYGEKMAPQDGFAIEQQGAVPQRYNDLLKKLPVRQSELFWTSIWELANNPDKLKEYDIKVIYGSVVYTQLRKGLIYVFKITSAGQVYPEIVPEM